MLQWLQKLLPKQKMQGLGDGNIQAGKIVGDLNHSQSSTTQHIYNNFYVLSAESTIADSLPPKSAIKQTPGVSPTRPSDVTQAQRELLRLMAISPVNESRAEAFMRREFSTDRVKKLSTFECIRATRYVEACMQRDAVKKRTEVESQA